MWEASVSGLLNGDIGQIIKCSEEGGSRCSPCQKYTTEPAEETLQMRVKSDTANRVRDICKDAGLTQGQGLELLMAAYSGNIDPLVQDLQKRLEKANAELTKRDEQIVGLREA